MTDSKRLQFKKRALIVSESSFFADKIETLFSNKAWRTESMSTHLIMGRGAYAAIDHHCIIFVIDNQFCKHFSGLATEMSALIRNASIHTPVYLLFENDDDAIFSTWLNYVKKTFKSVVEQNNLHEAIHNIACTES